MNPIQVVLWLATVLCVAVMSQRPSVSVNPHSVKKRRSLMNYYWNQHLSTGFFIKRLQRDVGTGSVQCPCPQPAKINGKESASGSGSGDGSGSGSGSGSDIMRRTIISGLRKGSKHMGVPKSIVACQGAKERIECPHKQAIKIRSAFWGRDDSTTCARNGVKHGLFTHKMCPQDEANTITKLESKCKNKKTCEVTASDVFFHKPHCQDTPKYLRLTYNCVPSHVKIGART